jgi:phospholipase/lecithinase/hemolysin
MRPCSPRRRNCSKAWEFGSNIADVYSLTTDAIAHPSKYGFTNVTAAALLSGSNGDGYLFWDIVHPTTQADAFIGAVAAQAVPEPSSLVMLATALSVIGGLAVRSRPNYRATE